MLTSDEAVVVLSDSGTQEDLMAEGFITDGFVAGMRIINAVFAYNLNFKSKLNGLVGQLAIFACLYRQDRISKNA